MNISEIDRVKTLADQRVKLTSQHARVSDGDVHVTTGDHSGALEIILAAPFGEMVKLAVLDTLTQSITTIDEELRSLGIEI